MYYILISIAALLFSTQFMFNNGYEEENGTGLKQTFKLSFYTAVIGFIITLIINKFELHISLFSLSVASLYGIICIILNYCTIKAFEYASLSVYTVFSMIGGMTLPFIYGIFCGEEVGLLKILCFLLITVSILLMVPRENKKGKAFIYYIGVFILNGSVGIISKFHQSQTEYCVDNGSFLMLTKIVIIVISLIFVIAKTRDLKLSKKSLLYCTGIAGFNSIGNLMLLVALLHLPASVQYPMVTGGTIVFSTIIDLMRKSKPSKKELIATAIAFVATVFIAF